MPIIRTAFICWACGQELRPAHARIKGSLLQATVLGVNFVQSDLHPDLHLSSKEPGHRSSARCQSVSRLTCLRASQIQQLNRLVPAGSTTQRVARRCRIILLAHQGISNSAIAAQLEVSRPTVNAFGLSEAVLTAAFKIENAAIK
jgi:ATP/maltotriose-dependent transcriptional regulator MalT